MNKLKLSIALFTFFFFLNIILSSTVAGCKDIVACGDATNGEYNLLLKVRDPSRTGLQVLCIVPENQEYNYHHPWTGKTMHFRTEQKYIGVASKGDTAPNIVKAGMTLSASGIAYGDSDTDSRWRNPTKKAWDDFDWIRYACQKAESEDEAVKLLTEGAVKEMHATGVSENLFVVGPDKGYIVEADAFHYKIDEITDGIAVRHNYPKMLWKTQILKRLPISRDFDTVVEKEISKGRTARLGSIYGIRINDIDDDSITVSPTGFIHVLRTNNMGFKTEIKTGERKSVGYFSVELLGINGNKATIRVANIYKTWEDKLMSYIQPKYGSISVCDMINWSRLDSEDLDGLRGMSQNNVKFESVAVYKIPKQNFEDLSIGWFSANNACSSIYIPFHICNTDIFDPYESGDAAQLSLNLLKVYNDLSKNFSKTEDVFFYEIDSMEKISVDLMKDDVDISLFLTINDMGMQRQAYYTEELWMQASEKSNKQEILDVLSNLWSFNYSISLNKMEKAIADLGSISGSTNIIEKIEDIVLDVCKTRIDVSNSIGKQSQNVENNYNEGSKFIRQGKYEFGFEYIKGAFIESTMLLQGHSINKPEDVSSGEGNEINLLLIIIGVFTIITPIVVFVKKRY